MAGSFVSKTTALSLARWAVILFAAAMFSVAIYGTVLFPDYARQHAADFTPNEFWSPAQTQAGLVQLGLPPTFPAYIELARTLTMMVVSGAVGLLILWRQKHDWFSLYLAFVMIGATGGEATFLPVVSQAPWLAPIDNFLGASSWQLFFILFYLFPNGKPVPGWTRWLVLLWFVLILLGTFPAISSAFQSMLPLYLALVFGAIASQVYRYFYHSDAVQRQQTKPVVIAIVLLALPVLTSGLVFRPPTGTDLGIPLITVVIFVAFFNVMFTLIPLSIAVAIFKYRLWDIDLVIRRTLIYGVISTILAGLYLGGVALLQQLATQTIGHQTPLAVLIVTLLLAALFSPLRRLIQNSIDRRFYRSRYNAELIMQRFVERARSQADLDQLSSELLSSVNESLQPQMSSLWIVRASPPEAAQTAGAAQVQR